MEVQLIMFREDGTKRALPLAQGVNTIGRKDDCSIRIPLATISRRHAEIVVNDGTVTIKDLGAANGTFVNNQRIEKKQLNPGDQILVGPVVFTVRIDGSPGDDELMKIRTKIAAAQKASRVPGVATSQHVLTGDEEIDPISALEALASSADQTAIHPEDDEIELS